MTNTDTTHMYEGPKRRRTWLGVAGEEWVIARTQHAARRNGERVSVIRWWEDAHDANGIRRAGSVGVTHITGDGRYDHTVHARDLLPAGSTDADVLVWASERLSGRMSTADHEPPLTPPTGSWLDTPMTNTDTTDLEVAHAMECEDEPPHSYRDCAHFAPAFTTRTMDASSSGEMCALCGEPMDAGAEVADIDTTSAHVWATAEWCTVHAGCA